MTGLRRGGRFAGVGLADGWGLICWKFADQPFTLPEFAACALALDLRLSCGGLVIIARELNYADEMAPVVLEIEAIFRHHD